MGDSEIINANEQLPSSIKRELHVPSQSPSIVLQNIDNINEYYGIIEIETINKLIIDNKILKFPIPINKEETSSLFNIRATLQNGGDNQNTEKILKALNKFLAKHKYIVKENKLYTLYDKYTDNIVCIIAEFDNLYIIQIKEEFYKNNDKILKKNNKDNVKTKLKELYKFNKSNNLKNLLS